MSNYDDIFSTPQAPETKEQPFDKDAWAERKQAERKEVYELADGTAEAISMDGNKFQDYLNVQSRFDRYSSTNALLILAQMPKATQVKDFDSWKENGVSIKKQQRGISILEPGEEYTREDGSIGTNYNVKKVFDISQTTARSKPQPSVSVDERLLLKALIHNPPVPIQTTEEIPDNVGAVYDHKQQTIFVRRGMEAPDIFRSVSKELAHAQLALMQDGYNRKDAGFTAYCASYVLCKRNGIDVSGYTFKELPESITEKRSQGIREELSKIRDITNDIGGRMAKVLEPSKAPKHKEQER